MCKYVEAFVATMLGCLWAANGIQVLILTYQHKNYQSIGTTIGLVFVFFSLAVFYLSIRVAIKCIEKE